MGKVVWGLVILVAGSLAACGGSSDDDGDRGSVEVLEGEAAQQAATEAAVSLSAALRFLLDDAAGGVAARAAATTGDRRTGARAVRVECPAGGSVDGECREEGGRTVVQSDSDDCAVFDGVLGVTIAATGRLDVVYEATEICGSALPEGVASRAELRNYREEWRDGASVVRFSETKRLEVDARPQGGGCSANQGRVSYHGDLRVVDVFGELALKMERLELEVSSAGNPCDERVVVGGFLEVADGSRGSRFVGSMDGLRLLRRRALDGVLEVALDGEVDFDCLGNVRLTTVERLALGFVCPLEGEIALAFGSGDTATAAFTLNGLRLDYGADGTVDLEAPTCGAESLEVCM